MSLVRAIEPPPVEPSSKADGTSTAGDYEIWRKGFIRERLRVALWITLVVNPSFLIIDAALTPDKLRALLFMRMVVELVLVGIFALLKKSRLGLHHPQFLLLIAMCDTGLGISHFTHVTGGFASPHYSGFYLLFFGAAVFLPGNWRIHAVAQFSVLSYYFILNSMFSVGPVNWHPVPQNLLIISWICALCDLSVYLYNRLQQAEFEARRQMEATNVKLRELDCFKSEFFANVSHELRTPLTLILGAFQALVKEPLGTALKTAVASGLRNTSRLLILISELLDLAKFDSGRVEPIKRCINIAELVRQVSANFESSGHRCIHLAGAEGVILAEADPRHIRKVMYNLLSNAFKFSDPEQARVWIRLRGNSGTVELQVEDNGIGIPRDQIARIFDRFTQVEGSATRRYEGTGIGLALVKEIVAQHGGRVSVDSALGRGTTFTITLPTGNITAGIAAEVQNEEADMLTLLQRTAECRDNDDSMLSSPEPATDGTKPRILVVDDNADMRRYITSLLTRHYRVTTAKDGAEGLEQARALHPDLILSDVMMPRMSGRDLLEAIRGDMVLRLTPLIFLTARAGVESQIESLEAGADDYLAKPFDEGELLARVRNLLRLRAQERELAELNRRLEMRIEDQMAELMRTGQLKRFFSPQLAELIISPRAEEILKSHRREITVVFLDLQGFTAFAETASPEEVMSVLHEYQAEMGKLIQEYEGTLERFTGDGMMIFFNDPVEIPNHAERAVRMAVAMRDRIAGLRSGWVQHGYALDHRIGIAIGPATIGTIGFEGRWDYGAIGTVTNLAARLCSEAKSSQTLISHHLLTIVENIVEAESVGELTLKGFQHSISAYKVLRLKNGKRR